MIIKNLKIIFSIILAGFGLLIFIFTNFFYGHVSWINTGTFQINTGLATALSIFIFLFGLVILLKNTTGLFNSSPRALYIIRKIFAYILLGNLIFVFFIPPGPFLWPIFFNVVLIICPYLLFTKRNGYFFGFFFFILGLAYGLIPIFPGPTILMTDISTPEFIALESGTKALLINIIVVKMIVALSGCFILLTAFFKKTGPTKN